MRGMHRITVDKLPSAFNPVPHLQARAEPAPHDLTP